MKPAAFHSNHGCLSRSLTPLLLTFVAGSLFQNCLFDTLPGAASDAPALQYVLTVTGNQTPKIHVTLRLDDDAAGAEWRVFQIPFAYADNPFVAPLAFPVGSIRAHDARGSRLEVRDTVAWGRDSLDSFIAVPSVTRRIAYEIDLDPLRPDRAGLPMPGSDPSVQILDGAYLFLLPLSGPDRVSHWRAPQDISVEVRLEPGAIFAGHPIHSRMGSNYELGFFRAAVNPLSVLRRDVSWGTLELYQMEPHGANLDEAADWIEAYAKVVADSLFPWPGQLLSVGSQPLFSGLETGSGYWIQPSSWLSLPALHLHELVHARLGVRVGELDEPWFKEGMTTYLGHLLAVQKGWAPVEEMRDYLVVDLDTLPATQRHHLRDPLLREKLFAAFDEQGRFPPDEVGLIDLVYKKGAQASLLLDRHIQEKSDGEHTVYDLVRALVGPSALSFSSARFQQVLDSLSGAPANAITRRLLDQTGSFPLDTLQVALDSLQRWGRLGPVID